MAHQLIERHVHPDTNVETLTYDVGGGQTQQVVKTPGKPYVIIHSAPDEGNPDDAPGKIEAIRGNGETVAVPDPEKAK